MSRDEAWVEEAAARAEAATKGPWVYSYMPVREHCVRGHMVTAGWFTIPSCTDSQGHGDGALPIYEKADAAFIAASRDDVPRLCRELLASWEREVALEHGCREVVRGVLTARGEIPLRPYAAMARTVVGYIGHLLDDAKMKALAEEPAP